MSLDLFRNQSDNNSKSIPIQWLGATRENLTIPEWLSGVYLQIGSGYLNFINYLNIFIDITILQYLYIYINFYIYKYSSAYPFNA